MSDTTAEALAAKLTGDISSLRNAYDALEGVFNAKKEEVDRLTEHAATLQKTLDSNKENEKHDGKPAETTLINFLRALELSKLAYQPSDAVPEGQDLGLARISYKRTSGSKVEYKITPDVLSRTADCMINLPTPKLPEYSLDKLDASAARAEFENAYKRHFELARKQYDLPNDIAELLRQVYALGGTVAAEVNIAGISMLSNTLAKRLAADKKNGFLRTQDAQKAFEAVGNTTYATEVVTLTNPDPDIIALIRKSLNEPQANSGFPAVNFPEKPELTLLRTPGAESGMQQSSAELKLYVSSLVEGIVSAQYLLGASMPFEDVIIPPLTTRSHSLQGMFSFAPSQLAWFKGELQTHHDSAAKELEKIVADSAALNGARTKLVDDAANAEKHLLEYFNILGSNDFTVNVDGLRAAAECAYSSLESYAQSGASNAAKAHSLMHNLRGLRIDESFAGEQTYYGQLSASAAISYLTGKPVKKAETVEERARSVDEEEIRGCLSRWSEPGFETQISLSGAAYQVIDALAQSPYCSDIASRIGEVFEVFGRTYHGGFLGWLAGKKFYPKRPEFLADAVVSFISACTPENFDDRLSSAKKRLSSARDLLKYNSLITPRIMDIEDIGSEIGCCFDFLLNS